MFSLQWETETVVIKVITVGIDAVVTDKAVCAEFEQMGLGVDNVHLAVTGQAGVRGEGGDVIRVAVGTFKGLSIQIFLVTLQRISKRVMRKFVFAQLRE